MHRPAVSWGALFLLALALLVLPLKWVVCVALAGMFHELSHILACRLCGVRVRMNCFGVSTLILDAPSLPWWQSILCSLAGPMGSFLLLSVIHVLPELSIAGLIQGAYNLLPLYPLDGGRVLHTLLSHFLGENAAACFQRRFQLVFKLLLCAALLFLSARYHISGLLFALIPLMNDKFPGNTCVKGKEML